MTWDEKCPVFNRGNHVMKTRTGWLLLCAARLVADWETGDPRYRLKGQYRKIKVESAVQAISLAGRAFSMPDPADRGRCSSHKFVAATFEERSAARQALREVLQEMGRLDLTITCLGEPIVRERTVVEWAAEVSQAEQVALLVMAAYRADAGISGTELQSFDATEIRAEYPAELVILAAARAFNAGEYPDAWMALRDIPLPVGADEEGRKEAIMVLRQVLHQTARGRIHVDLPLRRDAADQTLSPLAWASRANKVEQIACLLMAVEFAQQFWDRFCAIRRAKKTLAELDAR